MTTVAVDRLKETRLKAWNDMRALLEGAHSETRAMTAEETARYAALEGEMKSCGDTIDAELRGAKLAEFMNAPAPTQGVPSGDPVAGKDARSAEYDKAFGSYIRRGNRMSGEQRERLEQGFTQIESRDMGEATGAAGGYLVPAGFLNKITEVQKWFGGVRAVANVIETATGQSLVWPVNDDTANPAVIIGEDTQVSELDLAFTQKTLGAYMWTTGAVRIGRALMQDTAFDLETVVTDRFGKRFGRGQNTKFTTGSGISGGLAGATTGVTLTATSAPWFTVAQLLAVIHAIDPAYRMAGRCSWMMNDTTVGLVQGMLDSTGRPLFIPAGTFGSIATLNGPTGAQQGADMLLGYPITVNNDLPNVAASGGAKSILFGDFKAGYIIRDVIGSTAILRLEERYADYGEVGFIGYMRSDGNLDDAGALTAVANHA
jgi:HK97 family phage major capsid protein